jgi:16S rRNA processing protein RimM
MLDSGSQTDEYSVLAAEVAGAHGVSGSLRLRLIGASSQEASSDAAARSLKVGRTVRLQRTADGFHRDLTLTGLRRQPKGVWIGHFKEVTDRSGAEAFHGCSVLIRESERAALPHDEFYVDQLLGVDVVTDAGRALGQLSDVLTTPAHDVYVTDRGAMIPVAGDFVVSISLEDRKIVVRDVPGLLDESSPSSPSPARA